VPEMIRVLQYGVGPIGAAMARRVVEHKGMELVAAIDIDSNKIGVDAGQVIGLGHNLGFPVHKTLHDLPEYAGPKVALHTTSSYFPLFQAQIAQILEAGLDIVSTSEELSFPWLSHPNEASKLDTLAKSKGRRLLGTGINPGFLMDALPLTLTALCQQVDHIEISRVINASTRRGPFQRKIGSGLSVEEFQKRMAAGRMGHVGLTESMDMIFHALGRIRTHTEGHVEPVVADRPIHTEHLEVAAGQVCGLQQSATGYTKDGEFLSLSFVAALHAENAQDAIRIEGKPSLDVQLRGTNGDLGTVAIATNAIPRLLEASPGLLTMLDLPLVRHW